MRKAFAVIAVLLALASCGKRQEQHNLTLMSYNVGVFSKYMDNSTSEIAALIRDSGADFVGLNELDSCNRRHANYQVKDLAAELGEGWNFHYASAFPYAGGSYGNGIVSTRHIRSRYRVVLPKGEGSEQRSMAVVETDECVFAAAHLDHRSKEAALEQLRVATEWMTRVYGGAAKPVFLCGDFNVTPDSEVITRAKESWTLLSGAGFSYSTRNPSKCIDYIFALKSAAPVQVTGRKVITRGAEDLSDHFPILVKVKF